jgi:phycocyanobilin:ferredoxin oxidoreductase
MTEEFQAWPRARSLSEKIISRFANYEKESINSEYEIHVDNFTWKNFLWKSENFKRAHIEIVDASETKKMWVMHMCIYPHRNSPDPIFGFDIVCGKNKITGAFHDFSFVGNSRIYDWFQGTMTNVKWSKPRDLPEWARKIFSPQMVAAGNIQSNEEFDQLEQMVLDNLDYYLYNIGTKVEGADFVHRQNHYCKNQKLNPHTPAMMETFGVDKEVFAKFMDEVLFPENHG